jgi:hypothetical protein
MSYYQLVDDYGSKRAHWNNFFYYINLYAADTGTNFHKYAPSAPELYKFKNPSFGLELCHVGPVAMWPLNQN